MTGTAAADFNVVFGLGVTGGALLGAAVGGNASISANGSFTAPSATAASFQAYLASFPGLSAPGAVSVNSYQGSPGGPYTVSYGPGVAGDPLLAVTGGGGAFVVPTVGLSFSPTTTPAQFAAYLSTLPGLQAAGAVTVSGTNGGPFNVAFGPGVTGGKSLAVINNGPATITQQVNTGTPGANQWNPVNDESGLILNGLVINNSGAGAAPWYLSGNAVSINNTDTTLTSGITNTTVAYPTNPGVVPPGNSPITTVITLGQNAPVNGPLTLNSAATITDDGPAPTSVVGTQSSLLITSNINLNGNTLSASPSAATTLSQTRDTGLTVLAGTIMNADVVTFTAPDTVTFAYLAQQAAVPGFIYTAATTAAQFATYLATLPGLAALTPANVFGPSGGPFVVNLGSATPTGTALSVLSGSAVIGFTSMATNNAVVEAGYGVVTLDGNNSYEGRTSITSGVLVDGAANGLGNTFGAGKSVNPSNSFPIPGPRQSRCRPWFGDGRRCGDLQLRPSDLCGRRRHRNTLLCGSTGDPGGLCLYDRYDRCSAGNLSHHVARLGGCR